MQNINPMSISSSCERRNPWNYFEGVVTYSKCVEIPSVLDVIIQSENSPMFSKRPKQEAGDIERIYQRPWLELSDLQCPFQPKPFCESEAWI